MKWPSPWSQRCLAALVALSGQTACASSGDVGGVWRAMAPAHGADNAIVFGTGDKPVGIELVLGQFGPDLSGLVRYYDGPEFEVPRSAEAPDRHCACAFVRNGHADPSTLRVRYTLNGCVPGAATHATLGVRAQFEIREDGRLEGTWTVEDPQSPLNGQSVAMRFNHTREAAEVETTDLACTQPADDAHGNIYNGL